MDFTVGTPVRISENCLMRDYIGAYGVVVAFIPYASYPYRVEVVGDELDTTCFTAAELDPVDVVDSITVILETPWQVGDRFVFTGPNGHGIHDGGVYTITHLLGCEPGFQFLDDFGEPHIFTTHRQYCQLIAAAPEASEPRELQVGDRVTVVNEHETRYGETGTIIDIEEGFNWPFEVQFDDGETDCFYADDLELFDDVQTNQPLVIDTDEMAMPEDADPAYADANAPSDMVYQPHHYARFVIEPITFINANNLPYNIGNVIKYACRYDAKNGIEDLNKAKRYLEMQIEKIAREERIANGEDAREVWKTTL